MSVSNILARHPLAAFFPLSLFAWAIWAPQAAHRYGLVGWAPSLQSPLNILTVWAPGLAAMLITSRVQGSPGVGALFRSLGLWRVPMQWYGMALLFEPLRWLVALLIDRLTGQTYPLGPSPLLQIFGASAPLMVPVAMVFTLPNSLGEELGWRAFALPRLQQRHDPLVASVILGLFWGIWHLPMWVAWRSGPLTWPPVLLMALNMVPVAVLFTWIYNATGGSLLLVCLFHASMAAKGYLCPKLPTITEVVLLWLFAALVVARGGFLGVRGVPPGPSRQAGTG